MPQGRLRLILGRAQLWGAGRRVAGQGRDQQWVAGLAVGVASWAAVVEAEGVQQVRHLRALAPSNREGCARHQPSSRAPYSSAAPQPGCSHPHPCHHGCESSAF